DTSKMRAALERLAVAVASSNGLAEPIDPEESGADVPPALKDLADEMAGARVGEEFELNLLAEDRTDLGPFTLLGEPTSYYPLFETVDDAVILTLNDEGIPGGVWWIDEELDMHLLATSLDEYVDTVARAIAALSPEASEPAQDVWRAVAASKRSTFTVLESVEDLSSHVEFAPDGLSARLVADQA
ncbi:MAG: hypothetical protein E7C78_05005, partial [Dermabacter sp.]|nr:hypothetical protein [Dermabacter sp.]